LKSVRLRQWLPVAALDLASQVSGTALDEHSSARPGIAGRRPA
jgi:hypothetical protein